MTWAVATLNDLQADEPRAITDGPFGSNLASRHYTESGPRVVRLQNIGDGRFIDERAHISEEHFESLRAHEVLPGDLLVASLGEVLPRACLAPATLGPRHREGRLYSRSPERRMWTPDGCSTRCSGPRYGAGPTNIVTVWGVRVSGSR